MTDMKKKIIMQLDTKNVKIDLELDKNDDTKIVGKITIPIIQFEDSEEMTEEEFKEWAAALANDIKQGII